MTDDSGRVRIGTAEREDAMRLLGQQFSEGRLTPEEFSDRSAAVSAAVTRADLKPIFADLPVRPDPPGALPDGARGRDWRAVVMALVPLVAVAFTILVPNGWLAWLALPVIGMLLYGLRR